MSSRWTGDRIARFPRYVLLVAALVTALVFVAAGLAMDGGFERAWEILLGLHSPFGRVSGLGVALSAVGYLVVPTVIGVAVADGIAQFTRRRLMTVPEAEARVQELVEAHFAGTAQDEAGDDEREGSKGGQGPVS
jgi:hypothetical protein